MTRKALAKLGRLSLKVSGEEFVWSDVCMSDDNFGFSE